MSDYEKVMRSCEDFKDVMKDIVALLKEKNIKFTTNASVDEIIVSDETKKNIVNLIKTLPIPKLVLTFMLDICEVKKNVYIRKTIK